MNDVCCSNLACLRNGGSGGADDGALASAAVPHLLAGRQVGGGADNGALALLAVPSSEVVSKMILMGQPGLSFYVPVVRSIITLLIPYIILKKM